MKSMNLFMERAIELARKGMQRGDGGPFGAVVIRHGEIIGEGWNQVLRSNDPTSHAEIIAIRDACAKLGSFSLDGCEIFTTGEPCPMCLGAILWARIGAVVYGFSITDAARAGFNDREFHRQLALPAEQRDIPTSRVCIAENLELLDEYIALPVRTPY